MKHILLFDEKTEQQGEILNLFENENIQLTITSDVEQACDTLEKQDISILVVDMELFTAERMENLELIKKFQERTSKPLIFILSSLHSEFSPLKCDMEVADVIVKPYDPHELFMRIINQLKKQKNGGFTAEQLERMDVLFRIDRLPHKTINVEDIAYEVLMIVSETFKCESAAIFFKAEGEEHHLISHVGQAMKDDLLKLTPFTTKVLLENKETTFFPDLTTEIFWHRARWVKPEQIKNSISIPLRNDVGILGSLELYNAPGSLFGNSNESNIKFLHQVRDEIEDVLSLSHNFQRVNRDLEFAVDELSILYEISDALSSTLNLDELLKLIVRNALKSFDAKVVSLMMVDKESQELSIKFAEGLNDEIIKSTRLKMGEGIAGRVARTGQPLLLVDVLGIDTVDVEKGIKSALSVPLKIRDEVIGVLNVSKTSQYRFTETDLKLLFNLASLAAQAIEKASLYQDIKDSLDEIKTSYMSTVKALSRAIEAKDPYTRGHVDRVAKYGLAIAMELDSDLLKDDMFRYALVLHDIGKIEIPDQILTKPGYLTEEEMAIMKRHPEVGAQILSPVKFLKEAAEMVRYHQERYDGKGYPRGLKAEEIPLAARIISVADSFDAIISNRPYRKANSVEHALNEIRKNAGTQFDPVVVSAFISALDKKVIP